MTDTRRTIDVETAPWPVFAEDEVEAAARVLRSGKVNYWTGTEGREFEREYAAALGRRHAVAVSNGTVALELALLALGVGVFLGAFDHMAREATRQQRLLKTAGLVLVLWGALSLVGASMGGNDPWQPLRGIAARTGDTAAQNVSESGSAASFRKVSSVSQLEAALSRAARDNQSVLLDVYADWCVYCVKLDEETFSDPKVRQALGRFRLLKVDVTAMNAADKALLKRLNVYLPPAVMFFGPSGREYKDLRVVGFVGPGELLQRTRKVVGGHDA